MHVWCILRIEGIIMVVDVLLRVCVYVCVCRHVCMRVCDVYGVLKVW